LAAWSRDDVDPGNTKIIDGPKIDGHRVSQSSNRPFVQAGVDPNTTAGRESRVRDLSYLDPVQNHCRSRLNALANVWRVDHDGNPVGPSATEWIDHDSENREHDAEQNHAADEHHHPLLSFV
jgi:hypothetical protein